MNLKGFQQKERAGRKNSSSAPGSRYDPRPTIRSNEGRIPQRGTKERESTRADRDILMRANRIASPKEGVLPHQIECLQDQQRKLSRKKREKLPRKTSIIALRRVFSRPDGNYCVQNKYNRAQNGMIEPSRALLRPRRVRLRPRRVLLRPDGYCGVQNKYNWPSRALLRPERV